MNRKVSDTIQNYNMIRPGDVVCVGLSGGPDSVCLFLVLLDLRETFSFTLCAFHADHQLRGAESDADKAFVQSLCREHHIPLTVFEHDIKKEARLSGKGIEETARDFRRMDAKRCLENGATKIALAHHQGDQAETVLFHLARGSSVRGLSGILPVSGSMIRPLLFCSREEIIRELNKRGQAYRTDTTNTELCCRRNFLRCRILPEMEENINHSAADHISEAAEDIRLLSSFADEWTDRLYDRFVEKENGTLRIHRELINEHPYLARSVLHRCICRASGQEQDISRVHVTDTLALFRKTGSRRIDLPYGLTARSSYDVIEIGRSCADMGSGLQKAFVPCTTVRIDDQIISSEWVSDASPWIRGKNRYTKCFDYDKISGDCVLRTRNDGDRIVIDPSGNTKKLKDYFINEKIPVDIRERVLLLATGNLVHWVIGHRMGDSAKVTDQTNKIIKISVRQADPAEEA